jgi:hypothetical protein
MAAKGELVGEVDAVLEGGGGGACELHGIMAKLLEVTAWLGKGRGELTTASRTACGVVRRSVERRRNRKVKYGRKTGYK